MNVVAMLAWYDEPPELLHNAVSSVAVAADAVVAVDGAYRHRPGARTLSHPDQYRAIRDAADGAQVELHVAYRHDSLWSGQVEKRQRMLDLAAAVFDPDWVLPLDADWFLEGDRPQVRAELEHTDLDCLSVQFDTPVPDGVDVLEASPTSWHAQLAGHTTRMDVLMRWLPGIRVEQRHWVYSGLKDGERVGMWGGVHFYPPAAHGPLQAPLRIEHRCYNRDRERLDANRVFCAARDRQLAETGVEA